MATESDNVNSGALVTLLFVGAFAMLGITLVITALVRTETAEEAALKEVGADRPYLDVVAEQTARMAAPAGYVDRDRGLVSLAIDRAMELTVSGLVKDPNSATPPVPLGGAGGAASSGGTAGTGAGGTAAEANGTSGNGGTAGTAGGAAKPVNEAIHAEGQKPGVKKDETAEKKKDEKKPEAQKPHAPAAPVTGAPAAVPSGPAPAAPAPTP